MSNLNINMRGPPISRRWWKIGRNRPSVFKIFTIATVWEISVLFFHKNRVVQGTCWVFLYSEVMSVFFHARCWREVGYDLNELPRVNARQWESHTYLVSTLSSVFQRLPLRRTVDRIFFFGNERGWCDRWVKTLPFIFFSNVAYRERSLKINVRVCV